MRLRPIEGMMKRALHYKLKACGGPVRKVTLELGSLGLRLI